jgi:hypothetical protein
MSAEMIEAALQPRVREKLGEAAARAAELEHQIAALALDEFTGVPGVSGKREKLERELVGARALVERLRHAERQAEARDVAAENAATVAAMRAGLAELDGVCAARAKAAADVDAAIAAAVGAWVRLRASTELIRMSIPRGCSLPRGFVDLDLKRLVAGAMWKHSRVGGPGEEAHAFPGAAAPNFSTTYNAPAIENVSDVVGEQNRFVVSNTRRQIETAERFYRGEVPEVA